MVLHECAGLMHPRDETMQLRLIAKFERDHDMHRLRKCQRTRDDIPLAQQRGVRHGAIAERRGIAGWNRGIDHNASGQT